MTDSGAKSIDQATLEMIEKAHQDGCSVAFDRVDTMKACPIGAEGSCCKNCAMGPCRVPLPKGKEETPEERKKRKGICGATAETIAARNFARMIAAGSSAHGDHGRRVVELFKAVAAGKAPGYKIKDEQKLLQLALEFGVKIGDRSNEEIARDIGEIAEKDFGRQEGELVCIKRAPLKRQAIWRQQGVVPRGIDREVVEIMHRTHMGVDQDYHSLMAQGTRTALADGWGGSMLATDLQDVMFGTPAP
ncbi:MAG: hypothetical protein PHU23_05620, partial [Dehalococcoidales bacterium]|nr:hypothetical protein [Dehalococcoidales bacterium]